MLNVKELINTLSIKEKVIMLTNLNNLKKYENLPSLNFKDLHELTGNDVFDLSNVSTSWDKSIVENTAVYTGQYARQSNVEVLMINPAKVSHSSTSGKGSSVSEDPYLSGKMISTFINGIQNNVPVALQGMSFDKSMTSCIDEEVTERTIKEFHLRPFEMAIKEGSPKFVFTTNEEFFVHKNDINNDIVNPYLFKGINYKNIVVNQKFDKNEFISNKVLALQGDYQELLNLVEKYVANKEKLDNGEITLEAFNELLQTNQIIDVEIIDKLLEELLSYKNDYENSFSIDEIEYHNILRRNVENSAVLMKNEYKTLPMSPKTTITIIGDKTFDICSNNIQSTFKNINYVVGYNSLHYKNKDYAKRALKNAKKSEVVVVLLKNDSSSYCLNETQISILEKLSKMDVKVVGVLINNNVVDTSFDKYCDALLQAHVTKNGELEGLLNILCGIINPSGKLTHTFNYDPAVFVTNRENKRKTSKQKIGQFIGYRYFDSSYSRVNYPFGFGLNYTTFECSSLEIHDNYVALNVTNTGNVAGSEVIQLYVGKEGSNIVRVKRELKGFVKVFLQPGETKSVVIDFDENTFTYFNEATSKFEVEGGKYNIYVGTSIENILLEGVIRKYETVAPLADNDKTENYVDMNSNIISGKYTLYGNEKPRDKKKHSGVTIRIAALVAIEILFVIAIVVAIISKVNKSLFYLAMVFSLLLINAFMIIDIKAKKKNYEKYLADLEDDTVSTDKELPFEQLFIEKTERTVVQQKKETANEEEDLLPYYDNSLTINQVAKELVTYVNERGVALSEHDASLVLSAMSSSNIILIKDSNSEALSQFIEVISKYFGHQTSFDEINENIETSTEDLMWKVDENGQYIKTQLLRSLMHSNEKKHNVTLAALRNVDLTNVDSFFNEFIESVEHKTKKYYVGVSNKDGSFADGSIQLKNNVWYFLALKDDSNIENISDKLARNSSVITLSLKPSVASDEFTETKFINYYQFIKFVNDLKGDKIISEDNFKKIDSLEEYINKVSPFYLGNKAFLNFEKFMCIYLTLNSDELEALDNTLASKVLPIVSSHIKSKELTEDSSLIERLEKIFGEDNITVSTRMLRKN